MNVPRFTGQLYIDESYWNARKHFSPSNNSFLELQTRVMDKADLFQRDVMNGIDAHDPARHVTLTLNSRKNEYDDDDFFIGPPYTDYLTVSVRDSNGQELPEKMDRRVNGFWRRKPEPLLALFERGAAKAREIMDAVERESEIRQALKTLPSSVWEALEVEDPKNPPSLESGK